VAERDGLEVRGDAGGDLVVAGLVNEHARTGGAGLARVLDDRVHDLRDGVIEVGVREDDVRRLATELQHDRDDVLRRVDGDELADGAGAGERDVVDAVVQGERIADGRARALDNVPDAGREAGLESELGDLAGVDGRQLGRLEHATVTGRQRRRQRAGDHLQRVVPRGDVAGDAEGLTDRHAEHIGGGLQGVAVEALDDGAVVLEVPSHRDDVFLGLADRLADVAGLELRDAVAVAQDQVGELAHEAPALDGRGVRPPVVVGGASGFGGEVDLRGTALRGLCPFLAGARVENVEYAVLAVDFLAVDDRVNVMHVVPPQR